MRHRHLMASAAAAVLMLAAAGAASAQTAQPITIAPQALDTALSELGALSDRQVMLRADIASGKMTRGVVAAPNFEAALVAMLDGSGLTYRRSGNTYLIEEASGPQSGSAAGDGAEVEALIVTAQKREEDIQDVPIAISAFTQQSLDQQKIEGGFDLVKAIPNVTFSKTNFTSYNFSIRGVGTKAISATTDPGVAVAFNNSTIIQNRLFEQEYFDLERVEVLRGPQGTLFGRNATSGVINVVTAKPDMNDFDGWLKGEVGNFHSERLSAMINVPLVEEKLAVRLAGARTDREGYDFNSVTKNAINGRNLWSGRLTVGFEPTDYLRGNLIWERFEEDDNRSRTGKQLCHRDDGPRFIGSGDLEQAQGAFDPPRRKALFGQGCKPGSLYDEMAFGTPNGLSYGFILFLTLYSDGGASIGRDANNQNQTIIQGLDPYRGKMQSSDLREVASFKDPIYRAGADLLELNLDWDLTPSLTLYSQTAYVEDETYSFQDFNRFNSEPVFTDTSQLTPGGQGDWSALAPGGIFCDPQLGCSDTIAGFDIAQASAKQFNQELRLQSSFDGPVNFNFGANYTKFETLVDYYVMFNVLTAISSIWPFNSDDDLSGTPVPFQMNVCPSSIYFADFPTPSVPTSDPNSTCPYIDPNPVESIDGEGHNYFRSKNPYDLKSYAGFGEVYWNLRDDLKLTAGLRYTKDRKTFIPVPSQTLLAPSSTAGGTVSKGYPELPAIKQEWGEWTGRLGLDWKPEFAFTDDTLLYGFYSRGYKGGGANPPQPGFATKEQTIAKMLEQGYDPFTIQILDEFLGVFPILYLPGVEYERTFEPEFVDAFEVGAKNTLLGGAMNFNVTGFYYDYKDYQVSQIRDRTAVNENFDAKAWGIEFETMFAPSRDLQIIANLGYLDTEIADGEQSIDIMNRTQSDPNYVLVKPWVALPSNCIVPLHVAENFVVGSVLGAQHIGGYPFLCTGVNGLPAMLFTRALDPTTGQNYDPSDYPEINGGAGIKDDLGGNELPNAPHWTANIGAQYGFDWLTDWRVTVRGDVYWQSQSWHRVYNSDPYDKLHGWYNANLSVWIERPEDELKIELYVKNLLDDTPITDAFLNSDDTGLTTNVFTLDPRLIGLSIKKGF